MKIPLKVSDCFLTNGLYGGAVVHASTQAVGLSPYEVAPTVALHSLVRREIESTRIEYPLVI